MEYFDLKHIDYLDLMKVLCYMNLIIFTPNSYCHDVSDDFYYTF